jgi:hypothetical protein
MDKDYGDRKSSRKGGETSPEYHEVFVWDGVDNLNNMVLRCQVMDDDPAFDGTLRYVSFRFASLLYERLFVDLVRRIDPPSLFQVWPTGHDTSYRIIHKMLK